MESALPPTIQMLLAEFSDEDLETRKLHDRFRDSVFVRELKDQAKYSLEKFVYADDKPITNDAFLMYAGGGLNIRKASFVIGLRSEEHTSELQSRLHLVCRLLLEKKN